MEYEKGTYLRQHFNGNVSIVVWEEKDELWTEFIERIEKIVLKKLYVIGNSILEEIKRAFRMYMDAMKQNPEQIMKER